MDVDIFISYRRRMGIDMAGRIKDRLHGRGYRVFYDIESMHEGTFNQQIFDAIDACTDFVLVLPPEALDRCSDPEDWVRKEIEYAFDHGKNIIPVVMSGFVMPDPLPEKMEKLPYLQQVQASNDYFDGFIDRLIGMLHTPQPFAGPATGKRDLLEEGVRSLKYRQYKQAQDFLEGAMRTDMANAEVHFYCAVTLLEGKRPFLVTKQVINQIVQYLEVAMEIQNEPVYHYLMAYVKFDYHHRKMLRANPDFRQHLQQARELGITAGEIESLFTLLRVPAPADF